MTFTLRTRPRAEFSGEKVLNRRDREHVLVFVEDLEETLVGDLDTEEHDSPFRSSVLHVGIAIRCAGIVSGSADFVDRLGGSGLDDVLFAFKHERGGIAQVSMKMAVRVRCPLREEVDAPLLWVCPQHSHPVINRIVEFRTAFDMDPLHAVGGKS